MIKRPLTRMSICNKEVNQNDNNSTNNTNSDASAKNGNLNNDNDGDTADHVDTSVEECLNLFKACCKKKADFGLEDIFWIIFLLIIVLFSILKGLTRYTWSQITYMMLGSIGVLIILYIGAAIFNKFVLEDSSTAHWNAHARYTQAAIHCRLNEEEQRVHVIAPPKMGGAKLNIIYSVGDVPLAKTTSSGSSSTINGNPHSRQGSVGSGIGVMPNALSNITAQAIQTAAALLGPQSTASQPNIATMSSGSGTTTVTISHQQSKPSATSSSHQLHHQTQQTIKSPISLASKTTAATGDSLLGSCLKDEVIAEEDDRPETPSCHSNNNHSSSNDHDLSTDVNRQT